MSRVFCFVLVVGKMDAAVGGVLMIVPRHKMVAKEVLAHYGVVLNGKHGVYAEVTKKESAKDDLFVLVKDEQRVFRPTVKPAILTPDNVGACLGTENAVWLRISTSWNRALPCDSHVFLPEGVYSITPGAATTGLFVLSPAGSSGPSGGESGGDGQGMIDWEQVGKIDEDFVSVKVPPGARRRVYCDHDFFTSLTPQEHMRIGRELESLVRMAGEKEWVQTEVSVPATFISMDEDEELVATRETWVGDNGGDGKEYRIEIWRALYNGEFGGDDGAAYVSVGGNALMVSCGGCHPEVATPRWGFTNSDGSGSIRLSAHPYDSALAALRAIVDEACRMCYEQEH